MKITIKKFILLVSVLAFPAFAQAAFLSDTKLLIGEFFGIIRTLEAIVATLALLFFFWGLAKFILHSAGEKSHEEGRRIMFWGIIALFVMASVYGIISFINRELNLPDTGIQRGLSSQDNQSVNDILNNNAF